MFPDYHYGLYLQYFGNRDVFWLMDFPISEHPQANFENLWIISQKTRNLIDNSYDRIYMPVETTIPKTGCIRLTPKTHNNRNDDPLLLMPMQINLSSMTQIGDRLFNELKLVEYKPSLVIPLDDPS
jgi:hypothetical protein